MLIHPSLAVMLLVSGWLQASGAEQSEPAAQTLCAVGFSSDTRRPARVDNEAKACLDDVALNLQRDIEASLVIVGHSAAGENPLLASQRAVNVRNYLVLEKGIENSRMVLRAGGAKHEKDASIYLIPAGAVLTEEKDAAPVKQPGKKSE
jgi:hypothetical protein